MVICIASFCMECFNTEIQWFSYQADPEGWRSKPRTDDDNYMMQGWSKLNLYKHIKIQIFHWQQSLGSSDAIKYKYRK